MKRTRMLLCQIFVAVQVLSATAPGGLQAVEAQSDPQKETNPLRAIWSSPGPPEDFCVGQTFDFHYQLQLWFGTNFSWLVQKDRAIVKISAQNKKGKIDYPLQKFPPINQGETYSGDFNYTATSAGDETIQVVITSGKFKNTLTKTFPIKKKCRVSLQFNQNTKMSYAMVSIISTYGGSGELTMEDGQISGSGTQALWGDIPPYGAEGVSCVHSPPWEGSSSITFSGQVGEDGVARVTMALEALAVNASSLTCTGAEGSGGMPFPAYTYSSCEVLLAGFNFEAATLEVPFNCPGEEPYSLPITIIPRRDS